MKIGIFLTLAAVVPQALGVVPVCAGTGYPAAPESRYRVSSSDAVTQNQTQPTSTAIPIVKRDSLLNGLQIVVHEQPGTGTVSVRLRINTGAMFDLAGKSGLADLTARMVMKGGGGYSSKNLADLYEVDQLKADVTVGWDYTEITMSGPSTTNESIFDILQKVIATPAFDQKEFDTLKSERINLTKDQRIPDQPAAEQTALETLFGKHPYGRPIGGTAETLAAISRDDLLFYYRRFYLANNSEVMVSGDVTALEVTQLGRTKLGVWKKGDKVPASFIPPSPVTTRRVLVLDRPNASTAFASVSQLGISRRAPDYYASVVLAQMVEDISQASLSPDGGITVQSRLYPRYLTGPLVVSISAPSEKIAKSIEAVLGIMSALSNGKIDPANLERAKQRVALAMAASLQTPDGLATGILDIDTYGLGRDYLIRFSEWINSVTSVQVAEAAKKHLTPDSAVIAVAAPEKQVAPALRSLIQTAAAK